MELQTREQQLRQYYARVVGVPILTDLTESPAGAPVIGILRLTERRDGDALSTVHATYLLEFYAPDPVPDRTRRERFASLAQALLSTETAAERELFPANDYRILLEQLSDETLRMRIELEWSDDGSS